MLENSERRGVLADYMNSRQRTGIISSKVKMNNRFMDMDFLGGKEQAQQPSKLAPQAKPQAKAPRQSILNTNALVKAVEKVGRTEKAESSDDEDVLKELSSSSGKSEDGNFIEDAMDDLDALEKELQDSDDSDE